MIEKWKNNIPRTVGDGECVALIKFYEKDVLGFDEYFGIDYAKEYFTKYDETNLKNKFQTFRKRYFSIVGVSLLILLALFLLWFNNIKYFFSISFINF